MRLEQKLRKLGESSWNEQLLFSEAYFLHLTIGLILKVIRFKWIPKVFSSPQSSVGSPQSSVLIMMKDAIGRASRVSPWKNRCLVSSLAGRCMLRRQKIESQLSLGVAKDGNGRTIAHAWLKSGGLEIVPKSGDYTELYKF